MALLREIASIVKNDIQAGLKGVGNYSFSIEQIERELEISRNAIIKKYSLQSILDPKEFVQDINCLMLECSDMSECCEGVESGTKGQMFKIPRPSSLFGMEALHYIGTSDRRKRFKVYTDYSFLNEAYRVSPSGNPRPYVFVNMGRMDSDDMVTGYVFNLPRLKYVTVVGIFENAYAAMNAEYLDDAKDTLRFPMPEWAVDEVISRVVGKYIQLYKASNQPALPNTQTPQGTA